LISITPNVPQLNNVIFNDMKRYKPKNKELIDYVNNNEAIEAQVGSTTLISLEDVDIIIDRVKNNVDLDAVSNSFYCLGDSFGESGKCDKQCDDCRAKILKQ